MGLRAGWRARDHLVDCRDSDSYWEIVTGTAGYSQTLQILQEYMEKKMRNNPRSIDYFAGTIFAGSLIIAGFCAGNLFQILQHPDCIFREFRVVPQKLEPYPDPISYEANPEIPE